MPIQVSAPVIKTFVLEKADKKYGSEGDPTTVTIKQATQGQHEHRQQIFATLERRYSNVRPELTTLVQTANMEELKRLETYLTLVDCNMTADNGKKAMFPSRKGRDGLPELAMDKAQFDEAWGKLPTDIASEIHEKVIELNVQWGFQGG